MVRVLYLELLLLLVAEQAERKELQVAHLVVLVAEHVLVVLVLLELLVKEMLVAVLRVPNLLVLVAVAAQAQSVVMVQLVHQEMAVLALHGLMGQLTLAVVVVVDGLVTGVAHLAVLVVAEAAEIIALEQMELQIQEAEVAAQVRRQTLRVLEEMAALEL
jgi:hypothetical protein